jgi:hypothetical protein
MRKEKPLTMEEAVKKFAAITDRVMAKFSPEERARRFRNAAKMIASLKKKERAKLSKSHRSSPGRRRILARG